MNVAITRAKYCLYVVGNSQALSTNVEWGLFIEHFKKENCYVSISSMLEIKKAMNKIFIKRDVN